MLLLERGSSKKVIVCLFPLIFALGFFISCAYLTDSPTEPEPEPTYTNIYYPASVGACWTYDYTHTENDVLQEHLIITYEIISIEQRSDDMSYRMRITNYDTLGNQTWSDEGDLLAIDGNGKVSFRGATALPGENLSVGMSFFHADLIHSFGYYTFVDAIPVTVVCFDDTFTGCVKLRYEDSDWTTYARDFYDYYAPDVGLVKETLIFVAWIGPAYEEDIKTYNLISFAK